jgi:hypothetical protein
MGDTLDSHLVFLVAIFLIDFAVNGEAKGSSQALGAATPWRISTLKRKYFLLMCCVRGAFERRFPTSVDKKRGTARKEVIWFGMVKVPIGAKHPQRYRPLERKWRCRADFREEA